MKRLTERLSAVFTRLAFWRKSAAPADADAATDEAPAPNAVAAKTPPPADTPGLIEDTAAQGAAPLAAAPQALASAAEASTAPSTDTAGLAPTPPSLFARLLARLRPPPAAKSVNNAPAGDEADAAETDPPPRRAQRLFALLSKKIVWIPAASLALLALVGTLGALLWQSGQDRAALEARLKAAEQKLEQAATAPAPATTTPSAPPAPADTESAATAARTAASRPVLAGSDCDINDVEGVSLRLKDCIDAFNQEPAARTLPAHQASTPR